jgi:hypothetical protein
MKAVHSLRHLFTSQTRFKLVTIFFGQPKELFYVRELVRLTNEEINSVRRELDNLKTSGLISSETRGNRLYYWANTEHILYYDLVLIASQNSGLGLGLAENRHKIGTLKLAIFSQEFLFGKTSGGIDLILIGDLNLRTVDTVIKEEEKRRGVEINYMVMDKAEFNLRKVKRDPILVDFFLSFPAVVIGAPDTL